MFVAKTLQARPARFGLVAAVVLMCALAGCKKDQTATTADTAATPAATQAAAPPQQAVSAKVAAMGADQLRAAASGALREQRLYAPAGDNAMEYYLALRDKQPNDPAVASALTDLMPYTLIATEQSLARDDYIEAQRLYALMEKTDSNAPALPRLKQGIASGQASLVQRTADATVKTAEDAKRQADLEKQRVLDQQKTQQQAALQLAAQQTADQQAATQRAADERAAQQRAAQPPAATQQPARQPAATQPPPATATASNELRPISTPPPKYPPDAYRSGTSGEVQVEFTVGTDGSVTSARVVRATPPRVFDREALSAVKRWRFQPVGSPVTSRRTIGFNLGG
ncbi:MAG TPA: TonB family protein [Luteimonas sp.]|nr:TonB family protein [Luteimonas sp.]